jgi:hypothetical protein
MRKGKKDSHPTPGEENLSKGNKYMKEGNLISLYVIDLQCKGG